MGTAIGLGLNYRPSALSVGKPVVLPANFGGEGSLVRWQFAQYALFRVAFNPHNPMSNALEAPSPPYHTRVNVVPVQIRVPVQTSPSLQFTPAGTASSTAGASPLGLAQLYTGLP
ncbi:MAG: hypothetical protein WA634_02485 [Silvibacterium sp.]